MLLFDGPVVAGFAAVVLAGLAALAGVVAYRQRSAVRPDEELAVVDVRPGAVDVVGRVERPEVDPLPTLVGADDGDDPVVVQYRVERRTDAGDWTVVVEGVRAVPFVLADETGRLLVDLGEPSLDAVDMGAAHEHRHRVRAGAPSPLADEYADAEPRGGGERRYVERRLTPGDTLLVEGTCDGRAVADGESVFVVEDGPTPAFVSDRPDGPRVEPPAERDTVVPPRTRVAALSGTAAAAGLLAVVAGLDLALHFVG
jgi:hypothetical protein